MLSLIGYAFNAIIDGEPDPATRDRLRILVIILLALLLFVLIPAI
jgi:hypothetical protein